MADKVQLSETEKAFLQELTQTRNHAEQVKRDAEQRILGALGLLVKMRGLEGNWTLEGDCLVPTKSGA